MKRAILLAMFLGGCMQNGQTARQTPEDRQRDMAILRQMNENNRRQAEEPAYQIAQPPPRTTINCTSMALGGGMHQATCN